MSQMSAEQCAAPPEHNSAVPDVGVRDQRSWWRDAVIYQVYVRSFCDGSGDGVGDLTGVRGSLPYLADLGADGIWLNPFYPSPQRDHGYDIVDHCAVDPAYGTLEDLNLLVAEAHAHQLKVLLDLVPNHCSDDHPLFKAALEGGPGSPYRELFHFRDGTGPSGDAPPNNWRSIFGGPVWQRVVEPDGAPGQWYLHLFTPHQPDWNWRHPDTRKRFETILRFWLERGVDGFRIDAAGGLFKHVGLPDVPQPQADETSGQPQNRAAWGQPELHDLYRSWRRICDEYSNRDGRERILVGEIGGFVADEQLRRFLRPDELHEAFLFELLDASWDATAFREIIARELAQADAASGSVAWVLGNHDTVRIATRFGGGGPGVGEGDRPRGLARARAATLLLLALPGPVFLYQGDELGLPEVVDLADEHITDPIFRRTNGLRRGRDGCRVPLPWRGGLAPFGFTTTPHSTAHPWLPQPPTFAEYTVERQQGISSSSWHLCRQALALRRLLQRTATAPLVWLDHSHDVVAFRRGALTCAINMGESGATPPCLGPAVISSQPMAETVMPPDTTAWWVSTRP